MFKARDVMTTTVVTTVPTATMKEVAELLLRHRVSGVPVIDDDGVIIGVISEFDLLKVVYSPEVETQLVSDHMSTHLLTVKEDEQLINVVDVFLTHPVRRLPVVRDGKMIGLISRHDLIRFVLMTRDRVSASQRARFNALALAAAAASERRSSAAAISPLTSISTSTV
jgi:predicted transcriptional regulator